MLGACGSKFSAAPAIGGSSGASDGGRAATSGAGQSTGGSDTSDQAGAAPQGDAGADSGGDSGAAGASSDNGGSGGSGAAGGSLIGHGGSSGSAGSGGDQPVIPPLGLALWLRADVGVQQVAGLVQTWLDQSGNRMDATVQADVDASPQYLEKGLNDLPALQFDGVGNYLQLPSGFGSFSNGLAGFMVVHPTESDCASVFEASNGSEIDDIAFGMWQNKWTYEVFDPYIQSGDVDLLGPSLYAVNHRPANATANANADLRINRGLLQTKEMPLPLLPDSKQRESNFIGHTLYKDCNFFEGQISEIIVYQRVVTANEVKAIESYLAQHWKLVPAATL